MAGAHLPGDPYFPGQENGEGLNAEPELPLDDDLADDFPEDLDPEPEVENLLLVAPILNPNPRPAFQGLTPLWDEYLDR